jgi:hypothetical protein
VNRAALLSLSHDDLIALILAQHAQIEAQSRQISSLTARIAELEARLAAPDKTPGNSSIPPSKGQKSNLPDRPNKPRGGRPGAARALAEHPDRIIEATLAAYPRCAHSLGPAANDPARPRHAVCSRPCAATAMICSVSFRQPPRRAVHRQCLRAGSASVRDLPQSHGMLPVEMGCGGLCRRCLGHRHRPPVWPDRASGDRQCLGGKTRHDPTMRKNRGASGYR